MSVHAVLAQPSRSADARTARTEHALARYQPAVRPRVTALARCHPWLADLAVSFPALLFALAFPRPRIDAEAARGAAIEGASLACIAAMAGVPMWMRAMPAQAFARAIPCLPDTLSFRRRIANHFPRNWREAPLWLDRVALAFADGNEEIALWFAREAPRKLKHRGRFARRAPAENLHRIILWAWYSGRADTLAGSLIATRWRPEIEWKAALAAADIWVDAFKLRLDLPRGITDTWLVDGESDGFSFIALRDAADLDAEAAAMKNCIRSYGGSLADNTHRLWGVRRDGERVATLLLSVIDDYSLPIIYELSGARNVPAPREVWLATHRWMHPQYMALADTPERLAPSAAGRDAAVWRALWRPYWLAKRRIPNWLPLRAQEWSSYTF